MAQAAALLMVQRLSAGGRKAQIVIWLVEGRIPYPVCCKALHSQFKPGAVRHAHHD